jgi:hypothetical protein
MRKIVVILLLALVVPAVCLAQGGAGPFRGRGVSARLQQYVEEIWALQQLDTLALTDEQLASVIDLYARYPAEVPVVEKPLTDKLVAARARLIKGTPLNQTDLTALYDEYRATMQQGRGGQGGPGGGNPQLTLPPLGRAIWDLLTQTQKATLLGDVHQAAMNNQKTDRASAERALRFIGKLRGGDDATWTANRDKLAAALATDAGPTDSPARKNTQSMFVDYLNRVRAMSDADFANKQDELVTELTALLPPGASVTVALAEYDPSQIAAAMYLSFFSPRALPLLQELQQTRAKPGQ